MRGSGPLGPGVAGVGSGEVGRAAMLLGALLRVCRWTKYHAKAKPHKLHRAK